MKPAGLRISSGELKGRRLDVPDGIRPTEQKVREALFSIWTDRLRGAMFLDLFAGSGAVGIEALSRGALSATSVEKERPVLAALKRNAAMLSPGAMRVLASPVEAALDTLRRESAAFDLIFADPPYSWIPDASFFAGCRALLQPAGWMAVEHSARVTLPEEIEDLVRTDSRRYGESALSFFAPPVSEDHFHVHL
ncbi:MAG: 16S rRNA (guanine(966)-N(2))-methyltransferase RsmD [Thermoanaerobaculia bacterium]